MPVVERDGDVFIFRGRILITARQLSSQLVTSAICRRFGQLSDGVAGEFAEELGMSGLDRFVAVLSLFSETAGVWSVQEMASALKMPASTVYRIVRALVKASFLEPATDARYRLGSALPRMDRLARITDPIVKAGGSLLPEIVRQARVPCVCLLSRLCNDMVLCVAHDVAPNVDFQWSLFERGRSIPLSRGSTSKVILAQLSVQQRKKLLEKRRGNSLGSAEEINPRSELFATIRKQGYYLTYGEIDPALIAIAVPISVPEMGLAASLSLIVEAKTRNEELERRLVLLLVSSAGLLTEQLCRSYENEIEPRRSQSNGAV